MSPRLPASLRVSSCSRSGRLRRGFVACLLGGLALLPGCAKNPPGSGTASSLSGKRIVVTLQFHDALNQNALTNYHYYFLINYAKSPLTSSDTNAYPGPGDSSGNSGPVAVYTPFSIGGQPTYGNGFATSPTLSGGFTDFVEFTNNAYTLYHVVGDPINRQFVREGSPVAFTLPNGTNVLQFELDLSQLVVNPDGSTLSDPNHLIALSTLKYLQINVVATDTVPLAGQATGTIAKQVDALGNTTSNRDGYLNLDMSQFTTYNNNSATSAFAHGDVLEPSSSDVFVTGGEAVDEALDLINYSISVVQK